MSDRRECWSVTDQQRKPAEGGSGLAGSSPVSRQYSVLIATILRYPEVASVTFDPFAREVRSQFLVRRVLSESEREAVRERVTDALSAYAALERKTEANQELRVTPGDGVTTVAATWRADDLEPQEIGLLIEFLRDQVGDDLLIDAEPMASGEDGGEEELYMGEELIAEKIADLTRLRGERRLVACRDEGRLIVYHT